MAIRFKYSILFFWALVAALPAYSQVKSGAYSTMLKGLLSHTVPEISVQKAVKQQSNALFLDARELREFEVSHIPGAVHVGYDHFDMARLSLPADKNKPIIVYCSVGYRSEKIAEKLISAGYRQVSNLYGGIFEWVNHDFPVVNNSGATQQVHAYDRTWGVWLSRGEKVYK
ncbi:MAG: rhodanese-like domain-containing protein [Saprospiraceae bacterium]|nr:rhodanese-like domain-containing protein [Saprospiraceae bacterium]